MNLVKYTKLQNPQFKWKDRKGRLHTPKDMETRHVFMTLVMIWNHCMPTDAKILQSGNWVHHMYNIGGFYTRAYMAEAIVVLSRELFTRTDMEPAWLVTLNKMQAYLFDKQNVHIASSICTQ